MNRFINYIDKFFLRRLVVLFVSLFVMTLGVSLCIRSNLGSSPISVIPYAWSLAGGVDVFGYQVPAWTLGEYTNIMNCLLVSLQIAVLRRRYELFQLLQLLIGFVFGYFLDVNMWITQALQWDSLTANVAQLLIGGFVMGVGISVEVMTRMVMMPGEGITMAITKVTGREFGKVKIVVDTTMVAIGVGFSFLFFGLWRWDVIGIGTLISMAYVGTVVRLLRPYLRPVQRFLFGQ